MLQTQIEEYWSENELPVQFFNYIYFAIVLILIIISPLNLV